MSLSYILTSNSLCVYDGPNFVEVGRDHVNFGAIANLLACPDTEFQEVADLACIASSIRSASGGRIEVTDLGVFYNGELISNAVVDAIYEYKKMGLPIEPIVKFLENLMQNSSRNSIEQLWRFIEKHKLPLTEDGHLLAYKAVRSNYKDKHSGSIDNSVGQVVKMERSKISDDPNLHCHVGLHVGGLAYSGPNGWFSQHGDKCIIVKVNPKDVVCVPHDHECTKMRVCEYEVVKDFCDVLKTTVYNCNYDECECDNEDGFDDWEDEVELGRGDVVEYNGIVGQIMSDPNDNNEVVFQESFSREVHIVGIEELLPHNF